MMLYKSRLDIKGVIVIWIFVVAITAYIALSLDSMLFAFLFFIIGDVFLLVNLKRAYFYNEHVEYGAPFIKKEHIDYSQIRKITLMSSKNTRFEIDPSLIIIYTKDSKNRKANFLVKDNTDLISILNYLHSRHSIKIDVKSNLWNHIDLKF